jgi:hypothetical protein
MKKFLALLATLSLVFASSSPSLAIGWAFPSPESVPAGTTLVAVNEPNVFDAWSSWQAVDFSAGALNYSSRLCPNGADGQNCDPTKLNLTAQSVLSVCTGPTDGACVESLRAQVSGSPWVSATFQRGVEGQNYEADSQGAIRAGEISLWDIPGLQHSGGGVSYAVVVKLRQSFNLATQKFEASALSANVSPFTTRQGGSVPLSFENSSTGQVRVNTRHDPSCIWEDASGCGLLEEFPANAKIELQVRAPKTITGWFRGRLQNPEIKIDEISTTSNRITVAGLTVDVPRIAILATEAGTPASILPILETTGGKNATGPLFSGRTIKDFFSNQGDRLFEVLNGLRATAKDSAQGSSTLWNFTTTETQSTQPCFSSKNEVLGIVTTNASAYLGDPPEFAGGYLNYKVAGMHYAADGKTLNLGTYDLIMNSAVARCLYGFSSAPVQASIQVVSDGGEATVASTQVSERDGWLKLAAYGFTFSEKNIQVKFTQFAPKTITLAKFSKKTVRLNLAQKSVIADLVAQSEGATQATCTGFSVKTSERSLALSRAKEVCSTLAAAQPDLAVTPEVKQTKVSSSNFKVSIGLK